MGGSLNDIEILRTCGVVLHGGRWRTSLAPDLQVTERTIRNWLAGDHPIPPDVMPKLLRLLEQRREVIEDLVTNLKDRIARGTS